MMRDLSLAQRNLLRNRRRSFATFIALAIGTASLLLFSGYITNIKYSMQTAYVRTGGHLQIQHRDFFLYGSGNPTAFGIGKYQQIIEAIRVDPRLKDDVAIATPTLQFSGIAGNYAAGVSRTVIGVGLMAADHNVMRGWNEFDLPLYMDPFALAGAAPDAVLIGTGVARVLLLCEALQVADCPRPLQAAAADGKALPSDIAALSVLETPVPAAAEAANAHPKIELLASSSGGTPNVVSLEVLRAERQGFKELDEVYVVLQLAQAQRLVYGRSAPEANAVMVQLKQSARMGDAKVALQELLQREAPGAPLVVLDFEELNPFFVQTTTMFDTIFGFIFVLIAAIVLFTVSNTMNTAVVERTVEIGTLRAMGLRRSGVQRLFVIEGTLLGVAGALVGAAFALLMSTAVNHLGLKWQPPGSAEGLPLLLLVWGETGTIAGTTIGLIAIATLSAWWPSRRAARLGIVDALRHV